MKSLPRALARLAALTLSAAALVSSAVAAPTVYFSPVAQNVALGPTATVDIFVKDLTQSVGGVGMTLNWNSSILSGFSFLADPDVKMGAAIVPNDGSGPFAVGSLVFNFVSDFPSYPTEALLFASEGSGAPLRLATVTFNTLANGLSALTLTSGVLFDFDGLVSLGAAFDTGSICVGAPAGCVGGGAGPTIPEPTTMLLVASALGLAIRRRPVVAPRIVAA